MDTHDPRIALLFDDAGRLTASVPCAHCGYDLRTQSRAGVCPECGLAVGTSLDRLIGIDWHDGAGAHLRRVLGMLRWGHALVLTGLAGTLYLAVTGLNRGQTCFTSAAIFVGVVFTTLASLAVVDVPQWLGMPARSVGWWRRWLLQAGLPALIVLDCVVFPISSAMSDTFVGLGVALATFGSALAATGPPALLHMLLARIFERLDEPARERRLLRIAGAGFGVSALLVLLTAGALATQVWLSVRGLDSGPADAASAVLAAAAAGSYGLSTLLALVAVWTASVRFRRLAEASRPLHEALSGRW